MGVKVPDGVDKILAKDPIDLLMEEVTYHARREENFYLYRVYKGSYSYEGVFSG